MCNTVAATPPRKRLEVEELSSGFLVRDYQTDRAFFASDAGSAGIIVTAIMRAGNPPGGLADARNQVGAQADMAAHLQRQSRPTSEAEQQAVEGKHNAAKDRDPRKAPEDAALDEAVRLIDAVFDKVDAAFERFLRRR